MMVKRSTYKRKRGASRNQTVRKPRHRLPWSSWLKTGWVVIMVAGLLGGSVWLQQTVSLPIRHVKVEGAFIHVQKDRLIRAIKPYVTGSFMQVNVAQLREAGHIDPWIKTIKVRRQWPDTLQLLIIERTAIAYWGDNGVIDTEGEVFYPDKATMPSGLVSLQGPAGTHQRVLHRYQEMTKQLVAIDLAIQSVSVDARRSWQVTLKHGMVIKLGRADSYQRMQRFIHVYQQGLSQFAKQIRVVDMRYTNGLAVSWKSGRPPELSGAV